MYTSHGGGAPDRAPTEVPTTQRMATVSAVEHYTTGTVSLLVMLVGGFLLYPMIVTTTAPLHLLSTTAVVSIYVFFWVITWLCLELLWEWQAGRLSFS